MTSECFLSLYINKLYYRCFGYTERKLSYYYLIVRIRTLINVVRNLSMNFLIRNKYHK